MDGIFDIPTCDSCKHLSVLFQPYSGKSLCRSHLIDSISKRFSKALREQLDLPKPKQKGKKTVILVAISGGKDSTVLLERLVKTLGNRRDVEIIGGCVDEGISGYRSPSLECARELCTVLGIRFETISYPDLGFEKMDEVVNKIPLLRTEVPQSRGMTPCSFCGVFRRQGINQLASRVNADVVALGHNLDDMAQTIMMNLQKGEIERTLRLAPHTWAPIEGLPPRIVPLRWIPEQEIQKKEKSSGLPFYHDECPYSKGALRQIHREIVARLETNTPGSRHGLLHTADGIKLLYKNSNPT